MKYLNVQLHGLSGRSHPVLHNILTTQDSKKLRLHLKFLTCDYIRYDSQACSLCNDAEDDISVCSDPTEHVLVRCRATSSVRQRLFPELMNTVSRVNPTSGILLYNVSPSILSQFILDCTSFNLPDSVRIPVHNHGLSDIYRISRDWCFAIHSERVRLLRQSDSSNKQ